MQIGRTGGRAEWPRLFSGTSIECRAHDACLRARGSIPKSHLAMYVDKQAILARAKLICKSFELASQEAT